MKCRQDRIHIWPIFAVFFGALGTGNIDLVVGEHYLTCKRGSVGQSEGLSIPRSSVRFRLKPDNSNSHEFELHRPSNKGTKLLLKVIKAIIIIINGVLPFFRNARVLDAYYRGSLFKDLVYFTLAPLVPMGSYIP